MSIGINSEAFRECPSTGSENGSGGGCRQRSDESSERGRPFHRSSIGKQLSNVLGLDACFQRMRYK